MSRRIPENGDRGTPKEPRTSQLPPGLPEAWGAQLRPRERDIMAALAQRSSEQQGPDLQISMAELLGQLNAPARLRGAGGVPQWKGKQLESAMARLVRLGAILVIEKPPDEDPRSAGIYRINVDFGNRA